MTLGAQQRLFARLWGEHLVWLTEQGYEYTLDWGYRPPEVAAYYASIGVGIRSSLHTYKLAQDLNLFKDGVWLRTTDGHKDSGEKWESRHELCRWGGKFGDGNHYSMTYEGRS